MNLTPLDIQQQRFRTRFRGLDPREVDLFLDQMSDAFAALLKKTEKMKEDIRRLNHEINGYKNREDTFKRALLNSQRVLEQMKENARKSADLIVAEAEVKAEKILNRAHNRLAQLHEDIAELKRQRMQVEVEIGAVIKAHTKLLDMSKDGMKSIDEEDKKVKLLQK
jgi:cell division initiation protein